MCVWGGVGFLRNSAVCVVSVSNNQRSPEAEIRVCCKTPSGDFVCMTSEDHQMISGVSLLPCVRLPSRAAPFRGPALLLPVVSQEETQSFHMPAVSFRSALIISRTSFRASEGSAVGTFEYFFFFFF